MQKNDLIDASKTIAPFAGVVWHTSVRRNKIGLTKKEPVPEVISPLEPVPFFCGSHFEKTEKTELCRNHLLNSCGIG